VGSARPATARAHRTTIAVVAVAVALMSASTAEAAIAINGTFESSLSGWKPVASTLVLNSGGSVGDGFARASGPTASTYGLQSSQGVATVRGVGYTAGAWMQTPKRRAKVCLVLQERGTRKVVGSARTCRTSLTTWSSFATLRYSARGTGNRLFVTVSQSTAKAADVLDVDDVLVTDSRDLTPPSDVTGLVVTDATASTISVAWSPASDDVGVAGYGLYVDGQLVGSSTSTAHVFEGLSCSATFVVGVDAFDGTGNRSSITTTAAQTAACPSAPVSLVRPSVAGAPIEGQTLTASPGMWTGEPSLAFTWLRCDATGLGCSAVSGGSTSYTLGAADVGSTLRVAVRATNAGGSTDAESDPTALVAAAPVVCSAYAGPNGNDAGAGTLSSPFRTAQRLVNDLAAGETGCLLAGTYVGNVAFSTGEVTLTSAAGSRALLLGSVWIKDSANGVTLSDLDIDGHDAVSITVQVHGDGALLRRLDITNRNKLNSTSTGSCLLLGHYGTPAFDPLVEQSRIHNCGGGNSGHDHGIYSEFSRRAVIRDNYIYDNPGYGISMYPDTQDALIEHNVIDGNASENRGNVTFSGEEAGGEYDRDYASDNNLLRGNIITNSRARYNIESYYPTIQPSDNLVTNNCVWNAPWGNAMPDGGFAYTANLDRDPLFVDRAAKDFRLQAGSPCAGMGPVEPVVG
jgi:Right handed beta helix region